MAATLFSSKNPFIFELKIEKLLEDKTFKYEDISKFLPVRRDIAIVVDESVEVDSILDAVFKAKIPFLNRMALFDLYQGKGIAENKKKCCISDTYAGYFKDIS